MRAYVCDKCGRKIIRKAAIKDNMATMIFPTTYAQEREEEGDTRNMWASFDIKLNSDTWHDLCTVCIQELIEENINRK
ncbi:hypothetical protein KAR91_65490 [Candidatus Pacearchaeota archaeon]|nr:hypothetical protein [Candidatus Pacearchaeota archaeon]